MGSRGDGVVIKILSVSESWACVVLREFALHSYGLVTLVMIKGENRRVLEYTGIAGLSLQFAVTFTKELYRLLCI